MLGDKHNGLHSGFWEPLFPNGILHGANAIAAGCSNDGRAAEFGCTSPHRTAQFPAQVNATKHTNVKRPGYYSLPAGHTRQTNGLPFRIRSNRASRHCFSTRHIRMNRRDRMAVARAPLTTCQPQYLSAILLECAEDLSKRNYKRISPQHGIRLLNISVGAKVRI